jgi:hypothetical protein
VIIPEFNSKYLLAFLGFTEDCLFITDDETMYLVAIVYKAYIARFDLQAFLTDDYSYNITSQGQTIEFVWNVCGNTKFDCGGLETSVCKVCACDLINN